MYKAYTSTNKKGDGQAKWKHNGIWQEQTISIRLTITPLPTKDIDNNNIGWSNTKE